MPRDEGPQQAENLPLEELLKELDPRDQKLVLLFAMIMESQRREVIAEIRGLVHPRTYEKDAKEPEAASWRKWFERIERLRPAHTIDKSYRDLLDEIYGRT